MMTVFCPTCAKEGEWVATDRNDPIGYSGNFLITSNTPDGWGGVTRHLHFEVNKVVGGAPFGLDPYGWCEAPGTAPYTTLTAGRGDGGMGFVNANLWRGFQLDVRNHCSSNSSRRSSGPAACPTE
jgi:hypothetical protein